MEGPRLLLEAGADPNELNHRDETALHWAVWWGRGAGIVTELLDAGVKIDARRQDGGQLMRSRCGVDGRERPLCSPGAALIRRYPARSLPGPLRHGRCGGSVESARRRAGESGGI
ncbi:MAG TPA: ankyrin repeat domain-containing protein [Bryobacteraceae bacterium]